MVGGRGGVGHRTHVVPPRQDGLHVLHQLLQTLVVGAHGGAVLGGVVHALLGGQPQHGEEAHDEEGEEGAEGAIEPPQHDGGHAEGHEVGHEVVADVAVPAHRSACVCGTHSRQADRARDT